MRIKVQTKEGLKEGAIAADICMRLQDGIIVEKIHEFSLPQVLIYNCEQNHHPPIRNRPIGL